MTKRLINIKGKPMFLQIDKQAKIQATEKIVTPIKISSKTAPVAYTVQPQTLPGFIPWQEVLGFKN